MGTGILAAGRTTRSMALDRMSALVEPHIQASGVKTKNMASVKQDSKTETYMKETIILERFTEKESLYMHMERYTKDTLIVIRQKGLAATSQEIKLDTQEAGLTASFTGQV